VLQRGESRALFDSARMCGSPSEFPRTSAAGQRHGKRQAYDALGASALIREFDSDHGIRRSIRTCSLDVDARACHVARSKADGWIDVVGGRGRCRGSVIPTRHARRLKAQ
jgi:hypothetical protein